MYILPGVGFDHREITLGLIFFLFFTEIVHFNHISGENFILY